MKNYTHSFFVYYAACYLESFFSNTNWIKGIFQQTIVMILQLFFPFFARHHPAQIVRAMLIDEELLFSSFCYNH
ncbi:hypothetical protein [Endozoicomonas sp.]|uniref:hypothetical protein n=1 Tax=Endozoicomonas sp. TaxID=1892382 RepID=UPI00383AF5B7